MVFKLVQIDSESPRKILLQPGTHVFGRGKFLNVNDKRISREHGQFEVTDASIAITALHKNPCFYQKKDMTKAEVLRQNSSVTLNSGDKLGLLPTCLWYEVVLCTQSDNEGNIQVEKEFEGKPTSEIPIDSGEETDGEVESRITAASNTSVTDNDNPETESTEVLFPCDLDTRSDENDKDVAKEPVEDNVPTIDKTDINSRVSVEFDSEKTHTEEPVSPSLLSSDQDTEEISNVAEALEQSNVPQKRPHSVSEEEQTEDAKKIKIEQEESEQKPVVKCDPDGQQAGASANNNAVPNNPQPAPPRLRERCMYGASCYRRNPVHRAEFSHPHDADWGAGPKAPCPYGAACGKRDPRHWRDHDHPPGKDQPPPQPGVRVVHRQGNVFYINAHSVNFYDDHFAAEDSDGNSVDYDYEF